MIDLRLNIETQYSRDGKKWFGVCQKYNEGAAKYAKLDTIYYVWLGGYWVNIDTLTNFEKALYDINIGVVRI